MKELAKALCSFQKEMRPVAFDRTNPYFKSKYATLSALVSTAAPILSKYGLSVSQILVDDGAVQTILLHESGEMLQGTLRIEPAKKDPQGVGSAITYARRYSYASILGIVSDEDDDGNAATHTNKAEEPAKVQEYVKTGGIFAPINPEGYKEGDTFNLSGFVVSAKELKTSEGKPYSMYDISDGNMLTMTIRIWAPLNADIRQENKVGLTNVRAKKLKIGISFDAEKIERI
jgi:hypothetical protein